MKVVNKNVFVTSDGNEFDTEMEAEEYQIYLDKPKVYLVIEQISSFETIKFASCCYDVTTNYLNNMKKINIKIFKFLLKL